MSASSVTASADARETTAPRARRIDAIDVARGLALLAMATYHATWDLGYLRLTPVNAALTPAGRVAAHLIAGSFLVLVGIGLVLMNGRGIKPRPTALRLARVGGGALLITGATYLVFPESYIFFGILHCIAVSSVLALPFLFVPAWLTALAAILVVAAPFVVHSPVLDAPALLFLGLGRSLPRTNDWVPLFPWFGIVLAGVALGRAGLPAFLRSRLSRWRVSGRPARAAAFAGRHSLAVYLIHQPMLFGLVAGIAALTGPHPKAGVTEFRRLFETNCARTGGETQACRIASRCTVEALRLEGLWESQGTGTPLQRARARDIQRLCYEATQAIPEEVPPP